jgi:hypothetical protein
MIKSIWRAIFGRRQKQRRAFRVVEPHCCCVDLSAGPEAVASAYMTFQHQIGALSIDEVRSLDTPSDDSPPMTAEAVPPSDWSPPSFDCDSGCD